MQDSEELISFLYRTLLAESIQLGESLDDEDKELWFDEISIKDRRHFCKQMKERCFIDEIQEYIQNRRAIISEQFDEPYQPWME